MVVPVSPVAVLSTALVVLLVVLWLSSLISRRVDRALDRIAMVLFRRFISENQDQRQLIEAAYIEKTYRSYAAKTLLFASMAFVTGTVLGAYAVAALFVFLGSVVEFLSQLLGGSFNLFDILGISAQTRDILLVSVSSLIFGGVGAGVSYGFRRWLPSSTAQVRQHGIDEGLTRTTAFMYALSRGGMEFPQILRTLTAHQQIYGETAREMSVAVREMDMFGRDMITALQRMSSRTPSEQFRAFSGNLTSVLQSGDDLSAFLNTQFKRFRGESEQRQEGLLELLSSIAEAYVTVLVAGMSFFITILFIFGLTVADTLTLLQLVIYVLIPALNIGFALLVQQQLDQFGISGAVAGSGIEALESYSLSTPSSVLPHTETEQTRSDGGYTNANETDSRRMVSLHDRLYRIKNALNNPVQIVFWNPTKILWASVPIALLLFLLRLPSVLAAEGVSVRILDDLIVQSTLVVILTYAVVRYFYKRHVTSIEAATPEFLERLASLNEAGMSIVQSVDRIRGADIGLLSPEVDRIWRDLQYGSTVNDAFIRFGRRVRTAAIARVVTLLTNAMHASGNVGPVIRIAAEQHRAELSLRRQRRQQMLTYLVVIYIGFLVFLVIIIAISEMLVPNIPETSPVESGELGAVGGGLFSEFGGANQAAYTLAIFHAALIQAVCAGFIAGQLGEGSLRDGAKHAAIMLAIGYFLFIFLTSPIASIEPGGIQGEDAEVIIDGNGALQNFDGVSLSEGGFVAVYADESNTDGINGTLLGHTDYLAPGTHTDLTIALDENSLNGTENGDVIDLRLVPHLDTNNNETFDFQQPYTGGQVDSPYGTPNEGGKPGVSASGLVDDNFAQFQG